MKIFSYKMARFVKDESSISKSIVLFYSLTRTSITTDDIWKSATRIDYISS